MRIPPKRLICLSIAAVVVVALPFRAEAASARPATRPLNLSTGPQVALQAAQAAQAPPSGGPIAGVAVETATSTAVQGLTVRPEARGVVIASSDARPLAAPNFTAEDALPKPMAVGLGDGVAVGRYYVPNEPPPTGLLKNNWKDLVGPPMHGEVAIASVF